MKKLVWVSLVAVSLLWLSGCADEQPGELRGRLGGPFQGPETPQAPRGLNRFRGLTPPPDFRPRAGSLRFDTQVSERQIQGRLQRGTFDKNALPTLNELRVFRGLENVSFALPDGQQIDASKMCLMTANIVSDGGNLSLSAGDCPGEGEAVRASVLPLQARRVGQNRASTVSYFEIMNGDVAIGRFSGTLTFVKRPNGSSFPNGAMRYDVLDFCTTTEYPEINPLGLETVDYEKACRDAGLLS